MDKRVQRVGNAACLGGISHTRSAIINLYERFANDHLTVTSEYFVNNTSGFFLKNEYNISKQRYEDCAFALANKCFLADEATIERII